MLIRPLFTKYQKQILDFVNSDYGKRDLGINTEKKIVKFSPDSYHELLGVKNGVAELKATFFAKSPFLNRFELPLTGLEIASESNFYPELLIKRPSDFISHPWISFLTLTKNPDANPESTTFDGYTWISNVTWSTAHDAATGDNADDTDVGMQIMASAGYDIQRGMALFDTSSLTSSATISAAVFSGYRDDAIHVFGDANSVSIAIVTATPASNTGIVAADFDQFGSTSKGDVTLASSSNGAYLDITLTDLTMVSKTGVTKIGLRLSPDYGNSAPAGANKITFDTSDNGSNKPKLVVTYTISTSGLRGFFEV